MITLIAARSRNGVIGVDGELPWHIPEDLRRFKQLTLSGTVVMGRKTYESIGKALPDRQNIVLSSQLGFELEDAQVVTSWDDAIAAAQTNNICVIGGSEIYKLALDNHIDKLVVTIVNIYIDTSQYQEVSYFPYIDPEIWKSVFNSRTDKFYSESANVEYAVVEYVHRFSGVKYTPMVYLPASRFEDQTEKMEQIIQDGLCPFCPEWLDWYHDSPVVFETQHWVVTPNDNPYSGTVLDLLLIPKEHVTTFDQLSHEAQEEFGVVIAKIITDNELDFGALGMRFGQMWHTGGSVAHLHAQLKVGDVHNPEHQPIRFKMSSKRQENKPPTIK